MAHMKTLDKLNFEVTILKNPRIRCVPDQITGKKFALCLMETDDAKDNRIQKHISHYMTPKELTAFIWGYYTCMVNKVLD